MSNVYHALRAGALQQNWSNLALLSAGDDWSAIPSIIGYRGDNLTAATGTDPQTLTADDAAPVVDVNVNQTAPNTFNTGGVTEFEIADPTIALAGSGTADAPYLVIHLDTTGVSNTVFTFNARDIDGSADDAIQTLAVQYRIGSSGTWINLPAGFVADATTANAATLVTPVSVTLPSAADNQAQVQLRVITTNAVGNDEWVGIDDISVTSTPGAAATVSIADATILEGNAGTTPLVFTVTRTDTIAAATVDYTVSFPGTASASDIAGTLTGTVSFAAGATTATVTVDLAADTTGEPDETFVVTLSNPSAGLTLGDAVATGTIINDDLTITKISTIQGSGATSTLVGQTVTVQAIVVGDFQDGDADMLRNLNGFFLQEEKADWDLNALTSEGIFIFQNSLPGAVNTGDLVQVTGVVGEVFGQTQITLTSLSVLRSGAVNDVRTLAVDVTLPEAGVTGAGTNPDLERHEGMIVSFPQTLTINEMFNLDRFNEVTLVAGERPFQFTHENAPNQSGNTAHLERIGSRTITYDDGENIQNRPIGNLDGFQGFTDATAPSMGDTVSNLTGVLEFGFSEWRVRSVADGSNRFVDTLPREQAPPESAGSLDIVSFNVLNFFKTLGADAADVLTASGLERRGANTQAEFDRQVDKLITALEELDAEIYGLIEIENDFTPGSSGNAIEVIVSRLNLATGKTFAYVAPGGQLLGGDAIAVGFIYDTAEVRIAPGTTVQVLDDSDVSAGLLAQSSIGAIFNGPNTSRAVLAVTWQEIETGETFTAAVNHFKSKSGTGTGLDADTGNGAGNWNNQRLLAAQALEAWLASNPTGTTDADRLILGDLNSYFREAPIAFLEAAGYENLQLRLDDPYSYVFGGQLGVLDYILANGSLATQVASVGEWHINSNEADALDYNLDFGRLATYFDGSEPFRVSDHDPIIVSLALGADSAGDDVLVSGGTNDSVLGGLGDDLLGGEEGHDTLIGGEGNDALLGGDGQDRLLGEGGDDYILGGEGNDSISGAGGNDALYGDGGNDTLDGGGENDVLIGGDGDDEILAGADDDYALAGAGNDSLAGGAGLDRLYGEAGNDTLAGGIGNDVLLGGIGNDLIAGDDGDDYIEAGAENDTVTGGAGADQLYGEAGDDSLAGGAADDVMVSAAGNDTLSGDNGDDYLLAGIGNDTLSGGAGVDRLYGEEGNDTLSGGAGGDVLIAGDGNDLAFGGDGEDYAEGGLGADTLSGDEALDRLYGGLGNDSLAGGNGHDVLIGGEDDDTLSGQGDNDWMQAEAGNDMLSGGEGADYLDGGIGADTLDGGAGNDALIGGGGDDIFIFSGPGDGRDALIDFAGESDRLLLVESGFGADLGAGLTLDAARFVLGGAATQAFGQFLYDGATGLLLWDADGTGAQGPIELVQLYDAPGLRAGMILLG